MGAEQFDCFVERRKGGGPKEAFFRAVEQAQWDYGHAGYTGTIAEKQEYVLVGVTESYEAASKLAAKLIEDGDERIDDKWGPAGCIEVSGDEPGYLFFGWASS